VCLDKAKKKQKRDIHTDTQEGELGREIFITQYLQIFCALSTECANTTIFDNWILGIPYNTALLSEHNTGEMTAHCRYVLFDNSCNRAL